MATTSPDADAINSQCLEAAYKTLTLMAFDENTDRVDVAEIIMTAYREVTRLRDQATDQHVDDDDDSFDAFHEGIADVSDIVASAFFHHVTNANDSLDITEISAKSIGGEVVLGFVKALTMLVAFDQVEYLFDDPYLDVSCSRKSIQASLDAIKEYKSDDLDGTVI